MTETGRTTAMTTTDRERERLGEALDSMALLLAGSIRALAAPPAYSPFARARERDAGVQAGNLAAADPDEKG